MQNEIFTSATKIVLLALIAGLLVFTFTGNVDQEVFKTVVLMVVSFYFGQKTNIPLYEEPVVIDEVTGIEDFKK